MADEEKAESREEPKEESEVKPISASGYLRSSIFRRDKDYPDYKGD